MAKNLKEFNAQKFIEDSTKETIREYCNTRCRFTTHYGPDIWRPQCSRCPLGSLRAESLGKDAEWLKTGMTETVVF